MLQNMWLNIIQSIKTIFIFGLYYQLSEAAKFGEKLNEIKQALQSKGANTWEPTTNPVFQDRDETELTRFVGVKSEKFQSGNPRHKGQSKGPAKGQMKGRGKFGSGRGRWKQDDRHRSDYWSKGSNRKGQGSKGGGQGHGNSGGNNGHGNGGGGGNEKGNKGGGNGRGKRDTLPTNFDWRDYSDCQSLDDIRYQECGDCWSVSSTSVMSDRYCLYTHKEKFFSARYVTTCVYPGEGGCDGGFPQDAMELFKTKGVASGGDPTITDEPAGCLPYPDELTKDSVCPAKCDSKASLDVNKAGDYYDITSKNETEIREEIYNYGPVVAIMEVFDDFGYMGKGVYQHVSGKSQGYHAVRVIGYGVENGVKYWLVANSWGVAWGDKGYFKILRGKNHCNIESWVTAVYPAEAY